MSEVRRFQCDFCEKEVETRPDSWADFTVCLRPLTSRGHRSKKQDLDDDYILIDVCGKCLQTLNAGVIVKKARVIQREQ